MFDCGADGLWKYGCSGRSTTSSHSSVPHTCWEPAGRHCCPREWSSGGKQLARAPAFDSVNLGLRNVLVRCDRDMTEMESSLALSWSVRSLGGRDVNYFWWRPRVFFLQSYSLEKPKLLLPCVITAICPWSVPSPLSTHHACNIYWNFYCVMDVCLVVSLL